MKRKTLKRYKLLLKREGDCRGLDCTQCGRDLYNKCRTLGDLGYSPDFGIQNRCNFIIKKLTKRNKENILFEIYL